MTLASLRERVPLSYGWRDKAGRVVSQNELDAMTEEDRQKFQWKADPNLISELVQAERSETDRPLRSAHDDAQRLSAGT